MSESSDLEILKSIQAGDTNAESELLTRYGTLIRRKVSFHLGPGNADRYDVAAEAQMALLISLRDGKFNIRRGTSLGSYVYGITVNKIRDYYKSQKKRPRTSEHLPETIVRLDETFDLEQKEIRALLLNLLGELKQKYKEVLVLRFYKEMSIEEISKRTGLPPRRVSERIHYALKLIRQKCEKRKYSSIFGSILLILG
ncbi:sigma-70 family RNA polymerase sigma factor [bacterium]|nr:sigma-70 family RNA polymerase sigma factor [bacterium]